jgi:hypothetical protein
MFKQKFQDINHRINGMLTWLRSVDSSINGIRVTHHHLMQRYETLSITESDMAKIDALSAMVTELARRLDLAGVADLPSTCICEACGCKK